MRLGSVPRFSRATTYAPPETSYARTVCRYDAMTIAMSAATAIEIGSATWSSTRPAPRRTTIAASVAYATEEIASAAKIGSASPTGRSSSSSWCDAIGRPSTTRRSRFGSSVASSATPTLRRYGAPDQRRIRIPGRASRSAQDGIREPIAGAGLGEDVARPRRVGLELAPQLRDVHVEIV